MKNREEIVIYQTQERDISIDVLVENESVWLSQAQIGFLFGVDRTVISKHIKNIYQTEELQENSTCAFFAHMGNEGKQRYKTRYYNLDAILSVGYRVNSKNATQFRIWANKILKDYILKGYAINDKLKLEQYNDLKQTIKLLSDVIKNMELYPSIEEKAAMLLYLVTKNHSFSDGNKRIAAFLFLWFLQNSGILYKENGQRLIENNTLVALTLMIAESRTEEKDIMVKVVVNLINKNN